MRIQLQKESQAQRKKFKPISTVQEVFSSVPAASRRILSKRAKKQVQDDDVRKRLAHAPTLQRQGKLFKLSNDESSYAWSRAIQSTSYAHLKFALDAAQDTLPHNANLVLWRKDSGVSDKCKLCKQTLAHVLNCCQVALNDAFCVSRRKWRELLRRATVAAISGSYKIWTIRNHPLT